MFIHGVRKVILGTLITHRHSTRIGSYTSRSDTHKSKTMMNYVDDLEKISSHNYTMMLEGPRPQDVRRDQRSKEVHRVQIENCFPFHMCTN